MNENYRKKSYVYAIESTLGTTSINKVDVSSTINLVALQIKDNRTPSINTVKRWYKQYQQEKRTLFSLCGKGVTCKY